MRHRETRLVDDRVAVEEQVEVDRARAVALAATRSRPSRRSTSSRSSSSARGSSSVSSATAPFRNAGCSTGPHGLGLAQATRRRRRRHPAHAPSSSTARRIVASRSPRFAPSADVRAHAATRTREPGARNGALTAIYLRPHPTRATISYLSMTRAPPSPPLSPSPRSPLGAPPRRRARPRRRRSSGSRAQPRAPSPRSSSPPARRRRREAPAVAPRSATAPQRSCPALERAARSLPPSSSGHTTSPRRRDTPDPLQGDEWWRTQIGVDGLTPPGPGIPVTIVDSGHRLLASRVRRTPGHRALNTRSRRRSAASTARRSRRSSARRVNGVGLVGIYPQAVLRSWDAARGAGDAARVERDRRRHPRRRPRRARRHQPEPRRRSRPPDRARRRRGGREGVARRRGVRERRRAAATRSAIPAALPHVTTVAATDRSGGVASFSSRSPYVDLAAPGRRHPRRERARQELAAELGDELLVAARRGRRRVGLDGAAGARRRPGRRDPPPLGARHRPAGRDPASGFGMLNVAAALALPTPDPRPVRAQRRHRRGRPERQPELLGRRRR